jgi:phage terminase small subunit
LANVNIQAEIQRLMALRGQRTEITADRVLLEIGRIAFFNPKQLFNPDGSPKLISEIPDDTAAAIGGLEVASVGNAEMGIGQVLKYKISDKNSALEKLCKHLGLFNERKDEDEKPQPTEIIFTMKDARIEPPTS